MYCNAVQGGPSHGHRQHAQKFGEVSCGFQVMRVDRQTHRLTDKHTNRHTHHNTLQFYHNKVNMLLQYM